MYQKRLDTDNEKGYVKSVIFSSIAPSHVWYLPHHPVTKSYKPGKVQRVSNAASFFKGNCLNSNLLTGPDLINNLVGLRLQFRENPVAISPDIEAMFMQVAIIEKDQPSRRFLWPTNHSVKQFPYTRLIFGARFSPSTAIFVLQKTADFTKGPKDSKLVKNRFYMDDFAHSFETVEIAQEVAVSLKKALMRAGFKKKQNTMSTIVIRTARTVTTYLWFNRINQLTNFSFRNHQSLIPTQRITLFENCSLIACLFDPLGIIAPVIITLKIILQEIWKEGLAWDDRLPKEKRKSIQTWLDNYMCYNPIEIPRSLTRRKQTPMVRQTIQQWLQPKISQN